jgi:hypothetical protein
MKSLSSRGQLYVSLLPSKQEDDPGCQENRTLYLVSPRFLLADVFEKISHLSTGRSALLKEELLRQSVLRGHS